MQTTGSQADLDVVRNAFGEFDVPVDVREELESLVASATAVAFYAIVVAGGVGFMKAFGEEFGKLQAQRVDRGLSKLAARMATVTKQRRVLLVEESEGRRVIEVQLDPELPEEAYQRLADVLPQAPPASRLMWNPKRGRWCDPFKWND